jgi:hypothetical protein
MPERVIAVNKRARARRNLDATIARDEDAPMQPWNDPKDTLPLASFEKKERRDPENERRLDERRAALAGERRVSLARTLRALFQL